MVSIRSKLSTRTKYLYERYTEHIKEQDVINIYGPSSGWGGRILGAMSVMTAYILYWDI